MSKHTPGPWTFDGPPHNIIVWCGPDKRVAFIMTSDGPAEANARLMAAAPELLDALRNLLSQQPNYMAKSAEVADARAAIAKATGA